MEAYSDVDVMGLDIVIISRIYHGYSKLDMRSPKSAS